MRTRFAIKNLSTTLISHFVSMALGIFTQSIFLHYLGTEYLGLNGLFNNIVSMLCVVELGIGGAIVYNLYKPIAENNIEETKSIMNFYKKCYRIISIIVFIIGVILIPFLGIIVGQTSIDNNLILIIYILFIIDASSSYLLSYKRSILYASQKNYIIDIIHIIYLIVLNAIQILITIKTKNFILYLSFKIIMRLLENIVISIWANKLYPFLKDNNIKKINQDIIQDIIKKVKGLIIHKIGAFLVAGTDNIIISAFIGIGFVGLYSNYSVIITAISTIVTQIFSSFKASIGNLLVSDSKEKSYIVFKRLQFMNFWLAMMSSVGILVVMQSFITLWIGEQYQLSNFILIVLVICNYIYLTKLAISSFKEAAGIFYEDRWVPIIESIVNISLSIVCLKLFGLAGVFMGTIFTYLITHIYTYPFIVFKKIFNKKAIDYYRNFVFYILITIIIGVITFWVSNIITINNILILLIFKILCVIIIPNILVIGIFWKNDEFKFYLELLKKAKNKILSKKIKKTLTKF